MQSAPAMQPAMQAAAQPMHKPSQQHGVPRGRRARVLLSSDSECSEEEQAAGDGAVHRAVSPPRDDSRPWSDQAQQQQQQKQQQQPKQTQTQQQPGSNHEQHGSQHPPQRGRIQHLPWQRHAGAAAAPPPPTPCRVVLSLGGGADGSDGDGEEEDAPFTVARARRPPARAGAFFL
jgi:hypothetical protein